MRGKEEKDGETCEPGLEVADSQRGRKREGNGERRKEILVSTTLGVLCAHSLNMNERTTPQISGPSQMQQNNYFQDSGY